MEEEQIYKERDGEKGNLGRNTVTPQCMDFKKVPVGSVGDKKGLLEGLLDACSLRWYGLGQRQTDICLCLGSLITGKHTILGLCLCCLSGLNKNIQCHVRPYFF